MTVVDIILKRKTYKSLVYMLALKLCNPLSIPTCLKPHMCTVEPRLSELLCSQAVKKVFKYVNSSGN